ncbi:hypothetical protein CDD79_14570 [Raoultella ornithinolytica]|nr:hypothetical protein [Klebsiella grimontii]PJR08509.1 hypothetical protein CDD79_14570 [Raoultella ornithinolytica]RFP47234.1 hypothetical protein DDJ69_22620 [Klebsiella oxytoca]
MIIKEKRGRSPFGLWFALKKCCYDAKKQWLRTSAVSTTALNGLAIFAESFRSDGCGELQTVQRCVGDGGWTRTTDQELSRNLHFTLVPDEACGSLT